MEKYGVQLDPEGVKVSEDLTVTPKCGACGSPLEPTANVPKCPRCGTKPFESAGPRKP
jgi:predicted RNA-binding Zn-ribbon protein involved in translation (DUF1610 family)